MRPLLALLLVACVRDVEDVLDYDPVMVVDADEAEAACAEGGQEVRISATWTADVLRDVSVRTENEPFVIFDANEEGECQPQQGEQCEWSFERGEVFAPGNLFAEVECETWTLSEDTMVGLSLWVLRRDRKLGLLHIEPVLD